MRSHSIVCKTEEEWLEERSHSIGGSDSATVLGINPWDSPLQLWQRYRGLAPPKPVTEPMKMGHRMEPVIDELVQEMGRETIDLGPYTLQRNDECPCSHATLDRILRPVPQYEGQGVGEYKNVGGHMAEHWADGPPLYVQCQCQHNMAVTDLEWAMAAAIIGGNYAIEKFVWFDVLRNDKFIAYLMEEEKKFWKMVEDGDPPKATGEDLDAVKLLYPQHEPGKIIQLNEEGIRLTEVRDRCRTALKDLKHEDGAAQARLEQIIGDAEIAFMPDRSGWTFKTSHRKAYEKKVDEAYIRSLRRSKAPK